MATLGASALTLTDWAKRLDPDGSVPTVIELLSQTNDILQDMLFVQGNLPTGHRTTMRTGLPEVAWRLLNQGVQPSKSTTVQVDDTAGMLEAYSKVDIDLLKLNGNDLAFRLSEDVAFLEAMNQEFSSQLFYGNTDVDPEKFLGLAPRYNDLGAANGQNIIEGGGTGSDNTSIWFVVWGDRFVHGIFPKGSQAGLQMRDLGENTVTDSAGAEHQVMRTHLQWKAGLSLRDWRYVVRIANIDASNLSQDTSGSSADLINLMIKAEETVQNIGAGTARIYCNRTVRSYLRQQRTLHSRAFIQQDMVEGKMQTSFNGIPIRICDALTLTEGRVT